MEIKMMDRAALRAWVNELPFSPVVATLLAGDRLACCDEAVGIEVRGKIVAGATIAPEGEELDGQPTIVGVYCLPVFRLSGYGRAAFLAAIKRCRKRGFERVRVDIISAGMRRIIQSLSREEREYLIIMDFGPLLDILET